ncbi:MAG: thioredoxin [Candidatus Omnitrophica bacterium]|nr:thioredoxin [Candidatus Omnitrophota bacterium]
MRIIDLDSENFKGEVWDCDLPVLIDFWAEWCGPCQKMHPIIEDLAQEYAGKVKFVKLNVDKFPEIASQFGIMSIPTFIFLKGKKIIWQAVGALSKRDLKQKLDQEII